MRRVCPKCGSTSVIMFDADEDWCTQCKARFHGESTAHQDGLAAIHAEVSALRTRAETAERERDEAYFKGQSDMFATVIRLMEEADQAHREYDETWAHLEEAIAGLTIKDRP